jgi:hypothetical protein
MILLTLILCILEIIIMIYFSIQTTHLINWKIISFKDKSSFKFNFIILIYLDRNYFEAYLNIYFYSYK